MRRSSNSNGTVAGVREKNEMASDPDAVVESVNTDSMRADDTRPLVLVSSCKAKESMIAVCEGDIAKTPEFVSNLLDYLLLDMPSASDSRAFIEHLSVRTMDVLGALMEHAERAKALHGAQSNPTGADEMTQTPTCLPSSALDRVKWVLLGSAMQWSILRPMASGALLYELCGVKESSNAAIGCVALMLASARLWYGLSVVLGVFCGHRLAARPDDALGPMAGALALALYAGT